MQGTANLNLMIKAARKAGRALVKDFREVKTFRSLPRGRATLSPRPTVRLSGSSRKT